MKFPGNHGSLKTCPLWNLKKTKRITEVPDIRHVVIICQHQGSLKAAQCQVVLSSIEATKTHIIPELLRLQRSLQIAKVQGCDSDQMIAMRS